MSPDLDLEVRKTLQLQKAAIESAANGILITDKDGLVEWANPAFERMSGYRLEEIVGKTPRVLKSGQQRQGFYRDLWRTVLNGEVWQGRVKNRHKSGRLYIVDQTITPILDDDGGVTHFVAIHDDITARVESEERIAHMAFHDHLTGLPNRYSLDARIGMELKRARRVGSRVAVVLADLDNFKDVNDTFGHGVGDQLLVAVGQRLRRTLRELDSICRLGGDEFAVVVPEIAGRTGAGRFAERLITAFFTKFQVGSHELFVTASVGIAISNRDNDDKVELMQRADLALYRAKHDGRNGYRFFEEDMRAETSRRMSLLQGLRRAVKRNELFLAFQPQIELRKRRIVGVEALLRWRNPRLGMVSPAEFIPIAESSGLIEEIGEWVLREACKQAKSWQRRHLPAFPVAVNVSAVQLRDPRFGEKVSTILTETELEPRYLELELTERLLVEDQEAASTALEALKQLGIGLSLDDFGRGYASLDYLRRYPLSKVKIDQSFVRDMGTNVKNATIVGAVIDLAGKLRMQVIAEGVESKALLEQLLLAGCQEVQGFYFSRPVSAPDIEELLTMGSDRILGWRPEGNSGSAAGQARAS